MKSFFFLCCCLLLLSPIIYSQSFQTVRGRIIDKDSKYPLAGVVVSILNDTSNIKAVSSDTEGYYKLLNVPVKRQTVRFTYLGYKPVIMSNMMVNSAKELILNIEMEEALQEINEIVVTANGKETPVNDMAIISARSFSVEDADKYTASRQDPARMAGNFAGVNSTSDARNDIVIRGNSPLGLLWRLNDIDIPNPSHFAVSGSTGGPLSIINTKFLSTSDFMTGAFPAEYGNANAGVFDLKMRNGNNEKHEFTGQFGILGTELAAEGPFSKNSKASYLATFRYSTLQMLQGLKIKIGTDAIPKYGDGSFRFNIPTKKAGSFSLFGILGISTIDIVYSNTNKKPEDLYAILNRDQYFRTNMGVFGLQHTYSVNPKTFLTSTLSQTVQNVNSHHDLIYRDTTFKLTGLSRILGNSQRELKTAISQSIYKKIDNRHSIKAGYFVTLYNFNLVDSVRFDSSSTFQKRADYSGSFLLIQPYLQWKFRTSEKLTFYAGLHGQYLTLNNSSKSIEPRAGINWNMRSNHTLSVGFGFHSQMQPTYFYFINNSNFNTTEISNKNMGFSRSSHFILTYDYVIRKDLRVKIESYYQYLWNVPVYAVSSPISLINQGASFSRFFPTSQMENKGLGENYGMEFTVEKFFSKNYYFLWTTSLYNSTYKGSDNKWRNTDFNGNYITNLLAGYEKPLGKKKQTILVTGTKFTLAGGKRYSPADTAASRKFIDYQPKLDSVNALQFSNYIRLDLRIGLRINSKKLTHEIMLDLVNALDIRNPLSLNYAPDYLNPQSNPISINYQLGRLPLFYYRVDF